MNCNHKTENTSYYQSVEKIPSDVWDQLDCTKNIYFHPSYLISLEKNNPHLTFFYVVLKDIHQKAIAFASAQIIDFHIDATSDESKNITNTVIHYARKLRVLPKEKPIKILSCGNTFVSGEHGIFIRKEQNKKAIVRKLAKEISTYSQEKYSQYPIDIFIMKDFVEQSLPVTNELISLGYYAFNVEPNMKLTVSPHWNSFNDYLSTLKTKFRVKAKRALELSKELLVQNITSDNIKNQLQEMTQLYKRVASKADFNLGEFKLDSYIDLKAKLGDDYILKSYWLEGKMVGFMSGIINQKSLDAHFVGIDYELNKQFAIYQRMLYDYIDLAISKNMSTLNFGRTASEIKSSVGAVPEHLTVYIRHKKSITNKFLRLFLLRIQPTEFNQKFPFKIQEENR